MSNKQCFLKGMKAGIPIAMGYFAVAIALGIAAVRAGVGAFAAAFASLLNNASAGEYIAFTLIAAGATYLEVAVMEAVANARYLLMSASLSQKLKSGVPFWQRLLLGFTVTDEIFGVSIGLPVPLDPFFTYGTFCVATLGWTSGTFVGVVLGDVLPLPIISALSVGLYGMFISIFIPEARKNRVVLGLVAVSFAASFAFARPTLMRLLILKTAILSLFRRRLTR